MALSLLIIKLYYLLRKKLTIDNISGSVILIQQSRELTTSSLNTSHFQRKVFFLGTSNTQAKIAKYSSTHHTPTYQVVYQYYLVDLLIVYNIHYIPTVLFL